MTLSQLLRQAREEIPRDARDAPTLLSRRDLLFAIRHAVHDGTRASELADALIALTASTVLLTRGDPEPFLSLQDHVWRFSRLKGNSIEEAAGAAEEMRRRLFPLDPERRGLFIADLYRLLMTAEFDLLEEALS